MLCQNCKKNEATTHIKRIVNGAAAEHHLCSECAAALGYADAFGGFGMDLGGFFGSFLGDLPVSSLSSRVLRCEKCGSSFEDIAKNGKIGCAECYRVFYDKLLPTIRRIHGHSHHEGKLAEGAGEEIKLERRIEDLKEKLNHAIDEQNFELAAQLRDEIKQMEASRNE